ncbi:hypothetical protein LIA77_06470 [Sarocladium implicatum]|nr:hypothetical protein LIA77_06470 [Sarocladium implicatum]
MRLVLEKKKKKSKEDTMRYATMGSNDIDASSRLHLSINMDTDFDEDAAMRSGSPPASRAMSLDQPAPAAEVMSVDDVAMVDEDGVEQTEVDGGADVAMEDEHDLQTQTPPQSHVPLPAHLSRSVHLEDSAIPQCPPGPKLKPVSDIKDISQTYFLSDTIISFKLGLPLLGSNFYSRVQTAQTVSATAAVEATVQGLRAMRIKESSGEEPQAKHQKHSSYESFSPFRYTPPTYTSFAEALPSVDRLQGLKAKVSSSNGNLRTRLSNLRQPELLKDHTTSGSGPSSHAGTSRLPPSRRVSGLAERMRVGGPRKRPSNPFLTAEGKASHKWEQQAEERSFVARLFGRKQKVNSDKGSSSSSSVWAGDSDRTVVGSSEETLFESASSEDASDEWSSGDDDDGYDTASDTFASEYRTKDNVLEVSRESQEQDSSTHGLHTISEETCTYDKMPGELKPHICRANKPCRLSNGSLTRSKAGKWVFAGTTKSVARRPSLRGGSSTNSLQNGSASGLSNATNLITSAMGKLVLDPQQDTGASLGSTSKPARGFATPSLLRIPTTKALQSSPSLLTASGTVSRGPGNTIQKLFPPGTDFDNMDYYVPPSSKVQRDLPRVVLSTADDETVEDEEEIQALGDVPSRFKECLRRGAVRVVGGAVVWGDVEVQRRKP